PFCLGRYTFFTAITPRNMPKIILTTTRIFLERSAACSSPSSCTHILCMILSKRLARQFIRCSTDPLPVIVKQKAHRLFRVFDDLEKQVAPGLPKVFEHLPVGF